MNENLIVNSDLTPEERKEKARKAGLASAESRRKKKLLKDELLAILDGKTQDKDGKEITHRQKISCVLVERAEAGDVKAIEVLRDTIGEKPSEKFITATSDEAMEKMDRFFASFDSSTDDKGS